MGNQKQNNTTKKPLNQNKMKTSMQMAIDHYKQLSEQGSNQAYVVAKFLEENFLELEKQQIMKAVYDSMGTNLDPNIGRAEQYYNETYK